MADRIKGITIELKGDTTGLSKALSGVNKQIGSTQLELKDVERLLKLDPKNTELLRQKQEMLAKSVKNTEEKLSTLKEANDQVGASVKNYDAWKEAYDPIQEEIAQTKKKLSELKEAQKETFDIKGEGSEEYQALQESISETAQELKDLKKQAEDVSDYFGHPISQSQYDALQREIIATENNLKELKNQSEETEKAIKGIDEKPIEEVGDAADEAEKGLKAAGDEASNFGEYLKAGAIIEGAKGIASALKEVVEESKEYNKIMASLESSSERAGYSAEETAATYRQLYGVLGDEQTAATTTANLQALGISQNQLTQLTNASIGAWATYGDSIPIDGLAEAINETVKAGQVTGVLADVLNWGSEEGEMFGLFLKENIEFTKLSEKELKKLTDSERKEYEARKEQYDAINAYNESIEEAETAEDRFNIALQNAYGETGRTNLILRLLANQGLTQAGEKWRENNEDIVAANEAQADFTDKTAEMADRLAPIMNEVSEGTNELLQTILDATEDIDFEAIAEEIDKLFGVLSEGLTFCIDNKEIILAILASVAAGLAAVKIESFITGLAKAESVVSALTSVFPGLSSAIGLLTNPVFLVSAAVVALVALIATKGDEIQAILQKLDDFLQNVFATNWEDVFGPVLGAGLNAFFANVKNIWDAVKQIFDGVIDFIRGVFTGDWERAWKGVREILSGIFGSLAAIVKAPLNGVIGLLNMAINGVNKLITGFNGIGFDLPEWLGGGSWHPNIPLIGNIPLLAKGGILSRGTAIVGEAGPELLTMLGNQAMVQPLTNQTKNTSFGNTYINVYGAPGQNVRELAQLVSEEISADKERKEAAYA